MTIHFAKNDVSLIRDAVADWCHRDELAGSNLPLHGMSTRSELYCFTLF